MHNIIQQSRYNMAWCILVATCFVIVVVHGRIEESALSPAMGPQLFTELAHNSLLSISSRQKRAIVSVQNMANIGSCSYQQYQYNSMACTRLLYQPYRNSNGTGGKTCRTQMPLYITCAKALFKACVSDPMQIKTFNMVLESSLALVNFTEMACEYGGYPEKLSPIINSLCHQSFTAKYQKCTKTFRDIFRANPGDDSLCSEYSKATLCVLEEMTSNCRSDIVKATVDLSRRFNTKEVNPFCSISDGGVSDQTIMSGKLLAPPSSGASIPTPSNMFISMMMMVIVCLLQR